MKKIVIILIISTIPFITHAQNYGSDNLDFSPYHSQDKDKDWAESNARFNEIYKHAQSMYKEPDGNAIRSAIVNKIPTREVSSSQKKSSSDSRTTSGIQYENHEYYNKSIRERQQIAARQHANKQAIQAQKDAQHQQWLEEKRAAQAEAAKRERERKERERIEYERRYNAALKNEYKRSASHYEKLHNTVDYKVTDGFERMMYSQPKGTERMHSSYYVPSKTVTPEADLSRLKKRSGVTMYSLTLKGNEHSSLNSNWDQALDNYLVSHRIEELPKITTSNNMKGWDSIEMGIKNGIIYYMKLQNNNEFPDALGINDKGQYVFMSNNGQNIYTVSSDGHVFNSISFKENSCSDDNIVAKIRKDGFEQYIKDAYKGEIKGGSINFIVVKGKKIETNRLKEMDSTKLSEMLPQIKASIKAAILDNSSTMSMQTMYFSDKKELLPGVSANIYGGIKGMVTAGPKIEISGEGSLSYSNLSLGGKAETTGLGGKVDAIGGYIVGIGEKYYLISGEASAGVDVGLGIGGNAKASLADSKATAESKFSIPGISGKISVGGMMFKCISCE